MNKMTVSPINSTTTVPLQYHTVSLQYRLSPFSAKRMICKKKKKKSENAKNATQRQLKHTLTIHKYQTFQTTIHYNLKNKKQFTSGRQKENHI